MSMHLCGPELTTTSYKKRKQKVTKAQQEELERGWRERNQRLKEIRLPKETFEQYLEWVYGKGKKEKRQTHPGKKITKTITTKIIETEPPSIRAFGKHMYENTDASQAQKTPYNTVGEEKETAMAGHGRIWVMGACATKPSPTYTGTKIIGIGTMHKSNMVPIFSDDEAKDIATMRR